MESSLRPYTAIVLTLSTAGALAIAPTSPIVQIRAVRLASTSDVDPGGSTIGLVMGGSGIPLPEYNDPGYVQNANNLYIDNSLHPNFPGTIYPAPYEDGLFTPEYPLLGMPFTMNTPTATTGPLTGFPALSSSMGQDMLILENAIKSDQAAGDTSTVFGWSQSSTASGLAMEQLDPSGTPMPDDGLQFVLVGDPSNPDGGLLERFAGLSLPSLGIDFDGATPADDFPTDIYTLEYDGFADFPKYPINFLSDLNALLGFVDVHGQYLSLTPQQVANATLLPGSAADGTPDTLTNYYMIPETAPLISVLTEENPQMAALLGPALKAVINAGYGSDNLGYSDTAANVPTPFAAGLPVSSTTLVSELTTALQQGANSVTAAAGSGQGTSELDGLLDQLGVGGAGSESAALSQLASQLADMAGANAGSSGSGLTGVMDELSDVGGSLLKSGGLVNTLLSAISGAQSSSGGSSLGDLLGSLTGSDSGLGGSGIGGLLSDLLGGSTGTSGLGSLLGDLFSGLSGTGLTLDGSTSVTADTAAPDTAASGGGLLGGLLGDLTGTATTGSTTDGSGLSGVLGEVLNGLLGKGTPVTDLDQTGLGSLLGDLGTPTPDVTSDTGNIAMLLAGAGDAIQEQMDLYGALSSLPAYDSTLIAGNAADGVGLASAADVGLLTLFGGIQLLLGDVAGTVLSGEVSDTVPS